MIRDEITSLLEKALKDLGVEGEVHLEHPNEEGNGDYATNVALKTFQVFRGLKTKDEGRKTGLDKVKNPMDLAREIVKGIPESPQISKIEVKPPGFINFFLSEGALVSEIPAVLERKEGFGASKIGENKKVIVEYSSPNIAKPFGIGHLRSTIIGQAIYNIYRNLGYAVIGDNHLGDWGTQFGKLLYMIEGTRHKAQGTSIRQKLKAGDLTIADLERMYVEFHQEVEKNPEMEEKAREWFKKLEKGDKEAREIWQACVDLSLSEFNRIYNLLGVKIDNAFGESFFEDKMAAVIEEARKKNLAIEDKGALVVKFPKDELPPAILVKSDGATVYFTRDLATAKFRIGKWNPILIIYEVGADQTLYFRQVFKTIELLGWSTSLPTHQSRLGGTVRDFALLNSKGPGITDKSSRSATHFVHVKHGLIRFEHGKMSTRKGQTIHLEEVLTEAIERAKKIITDSKTGEGPSLKLRPPKEERGLSAEEKEKVARAVGIGAVKYMDLMQNPMTDIIFDWGKILNLQGNSGPYLQYTYARTQSIIRKAQSSVTASPAESGINSTKQSRTGIATPRRTSGLAMTSQLKREELAILRWIYRFPEVIENAGRTFSPNLVCDFLFVLAQKYNLFYNTLPILKAESEEIRDFRLALNAAVGQVLKNGLTILGIEALEKM